MWISAGFIISITLTNTNPFLGIRHLDAFNWTDRLANKTHGTGPCFNDIAVTHLDYTFFRAHQTAAVTANATGCYF